ncbi:MAG: zinc-binding dehydrogenase [Gammaproteobacteria bacterium]
MKALVLKEIGNPDNLSIETVDKPEPGPGEVRVALKAAALNRRDVWITVGKYPQIDLPSIGGSDGAGVIDAVGSGVDSGEIGREVMVYPARDWGDDWRCGGPKFRVLGMPDQGTFAEYICAPASDVYTKPAHLDWAQAAAIPLAGLTSWRALVTHGEVAPEQKVLVTGIGGGVATFALLWAKEHGAEVWVTSGDEDKLKTAASLGAKGGANYRDENWSRTLRKESGGFDIIIDSAGGDGLNQTLDTLAVGGRYIFFGATLGSPSIGIEMPKLFFKQVRIQGTTMGTPQEFAAMVDFIAAKKLAPVVDRVVSFDAAVAAHQRMYASEQMGKIVLDISL